MGNRTKALAPGFAVTRMDTNKNNEFDQFIFQLSWKCQSNPISTVCFCWRSSANCRKWKLRISSQTHWCIYSMLKRKMCHLEGTDDKDIPQTMIPLAYNPTAPKSTGSLSLEELVRTSAGRKQGRLTWPPFLTWSSSQCSPVPLQDPMRFIQKYFLDPKNNKKNPKIEWFRSSYI